MKTKTKTLMTFGILTAFGNGATLTGLWTFDNAANPGEATVGNNLVFAGTSPTHSATSADDGGNTQSGVITTISGFDNQISVDHGIAPNGGGSFVNQYSIVADIFSPVASRGSWRTIYQTNTGNSNDGDFFIRNSDSFLGVGDAGYSDTAVDGASWTRLLLTVDLTKSGDDIVSYLDGNLFFNHPEDLSGDGRFSLDPTVLFFSDNDGDDAPLNVGALAIYEGVLTPSEVSALGAAGTTIVPEPTSIGLITLCGLAGLVRRRR